ncbi:MAG: tetratricopeptide repeat-containing sensor histidine kinase [Bacteroidales bacterium]|nr:tetratricopeptide repeat-containing sensor histidine kinase [Bacteroidales bacterium]
MKKNILLLLIFFLSISLYANNTPEIDSLYKRLINVEDSLKAEVLNELSWELRNSEPEKSIDYSLEAVKFAEKHKDYENLIKAHSYIGVAYRILGNYSESTDYYYKGLALAKKYGVTEQEGYAYINIGNLHIYQGYYYNAIDNLNKAREIAEKLDHKRMLGYIHLNIGRAQMLRDDNPEALENFNKALEYRMEINQVSGQAVCYKYIGDIHYDLGENKIALENYNKSLSVVDKDSDKDLYANIHTMIAKVYLMEGNYRLSKENAEKSMKIADDVGAKLIIRDNFKVLSDIELETNSYKKASEYLNCLINYNDTLFSQQLSEKIFNLEYQIEKQKKQTEIDILNKDKRIRALELKRARTYNWGLLVILGLITIIFVYVLLSLKLRRKQNELLKNQKEELDNINKTKDKMFLIIGHDLRGPIGNLKSLIEMLLEDEEIIQNKNLLETFNIFMKSVQSVSDLLENLLLWAKSQRGEIVFSPENIRINSVINRNLQLFRTIADHKGIKLSIQMDDNFDVFGDKNMLLTVVRNIISNAIKYTSRGGTIDIKVEHDLKYNKVIIKDSGVGFDSKIAGQILDSKSFYTTSGTNNESGSGLGLLLSKEFVEKNGGKIWAESEPDKGATFYFTVPVSKM